MSDTDKDLAIYTTEELTQANESFLNEKQIQQLVKKTPANRIYKREIAKNKQGQPIYADYVKGGYVKKILNFMFGFRWDFIVKEFKFDTTAGEAYVLGQLKVPVSDGEFMIKEQFGSAAIKKKSGGGFVSIGNDLKAAATDALKKCASEMGLFGDVYGADDFVELEVISPQEITLERVKELFDKYGDKLHPDDQLNVQRIIDEQETPSYSKVIKTLARYEK